MIRADAAEHAGAHARTESIPIVDAAYRGAHVAEAVEGSDVLLAQEQLMDCDIRAHRQPAGAGVADHVHRRSGGEMAEVHPCAGLLHEQQLSGNADALGNLRYAR